MAIDHLGITVHKTDLDAVITFYLAALAPLGYKEAARFPIGDGVFAVGLGVEGKHSDFWIKSVAGEKPNYAIHIGFTSDDRAKVDSFHAAALKAGAKDNGAPGIRAHYHADYYGAFVIDPVGNTPEVVCHLPPQ